MVGVVKIGLVVVGLTVWGAVVLGEMDALLAVGTDVVGEVDVGFNKVPFGE